VRDVVAPADARARIALQLRRREQTFLSLLDRAVYRNPASPYLRLLDAAGAEFGDVRGMVEERGLEPTLARLRDEGVYVKLDETKGRRPVERLGVSIDPGRRGFDNPLIDGQLIAYSGGSSSAPRRIPVDLERLAHETSYHSVFREAYGLEGRPYGVYRVCPPSASGVNNCFHQVRVGEPVERWFNPYRPPVDADRLRFSLFTRYTVLAARLAGAGFPAPEYCSPHDPSPIVDWLAERRAAGRPGVLDTQASLGVRVCLAAESAGADISGTFFRFGGEPLTEAKAAIVARVSAQAVCHYTMAEAGRIGAACGERTALDDVHFLSDKLAVLQRDRPVGSDGARVGALHFTTLMPTASRVLINAESDDYAVLEQRDCGCPFGELGLSLHLHRIRSYEKLTTEGNHFLGSDLYALMDEVLPARFGGGPTDYQLVEEEIGGLPYINVVVRPEVGHVEEDQVLGAVVDFLRSEKRNRLMAEVWRQSGTLRVVREQPRVNPPSAKILPLHIARGG
jgi:hypothetical protein